MRDEAPRATTEQLIRVHPAEFVEKLDASTPMMGFVQVDGDTTLSPGSFEAALHSAGGAVFAVDEVMARRASNAFVATRPPGHHAETATAMGFCLFNNAAVAARHARAVHGASRVAIMDFDVHHGNGTQAIFWSDPQTLFVSTHQWPLYPGTGRETETGAAHNVVNLPLPPGTDGPAYRAAFAAKVLPRLDSFAPELVLVSAGFDGHAADPLANFDLLEEDFAWITERLVEIARRHAGGRLVSVLEGGYDLEGLANSALAHVRGLAAS